MDAYNRQFQKLFNYRPLSWKTKQETSVKEAALNLKQNRRRGLISDDDDDDVGA